ncbi:site-specific integrase [Sulfurimonas sp. SAG-AH-194-I05]|nr:site-specific integrase [Sulfurimonas sp. SAG-AH-194-I05]MDF1875128.1 site-specific integrase [Sulfurimonas sp. SAG-AH-194-I05]
MANKTLNKRIPTNSEGIFYKQIISEEGKEIDKIYGIRYREKGKDRLYTVGKHSAGIRINYCKQQRNSIINKIMLGEETPLEKRKKQLILVDSISEKYFEGLKFHSSDITIKDIKSVYNNHLKDFVGSKDILSLQLDDLEKIQQQKIKKYAPQTVNQIIELLSTIFNFGLKKQLYKGTNPSFGIKPFKVDNQRERYLSTDDIKSLYEKVQDNPMLNLFTRLALTTGSRLDGILNLQKKDIDLENNSVTLYDLKNKETYKGFLSKDVKDILVELFPKLRANSFIVSLDDKYTQISKRQVQCRLKPILDELFNQELEINDRKHRVVIHSLRHTFASHLAINGTPIFTVQKLMNHKDIKMTMRYAKLAPDSGLVQIQNLYK